MTINFAVWISRNLSEVKTSKRETVPLNNTRMFQASHFRKLQTERMFTNSHTLFATRLLGFTAHEYLKLALSLLVISDIDTVALTCPDPQARSSGECSGEVYWAPVWHKMILKLNFCLRREMVQINTSIPANFSDITKT